MEQAAEPTSDRTTQSILHLVKQVQYKAYVRLEAVLGPLGVTAVQFRILTTLSTRPDLSSAELARLYDVKPQTMIKQIALLETKGLIGRRVSDANKRLLELRLTPAGERTLAQLQKDTRTLEAELLAPLDGEEQAQLRGLLFRLLDSLSVVPAGDGDAEEFTDEYRRAGVQRP
ncbi:MarR family transcriptional regulator [Sphingomonas sp. HF-S4]|uniref:MarR family transcriptional regulator n=1 Tax=Sphingomonas agrestis TaxID=3080540 RepID=A0ABU3Y596_9SPHN|nr:MarR family transcriptional regulator [Sphingomonas sp. HF-S4]MDV3456530.1 MarR family transcriptional regulator [Sphingomonas sp. HF-S4]